MNIASTVCWFFAAAFSFFVSYPPKRREITGNKNMPREEESSDKENEADITLNNKEIIASVEVALKMSSSVLIRRRSHGLQSDNQPRA